MLVAVERRDTDWIVIIAMCCVCSSKFMTAKIERIFLISKKRMKKNSHRPSATSHDAKPVAMSIPFYTSEPRENAQKV